MLEIKGELTTKQIVRFILPLLFEQIVLLLLPVINSILVSSAGQASLSGVSLVDLINWMISYVFLYATNGIAIVAAQYFGRGDKSSLRHSIRQAFAASGAISLAVTVILMVAGSFVIRIFMYGADEQILIKAQDYFRILLFSGPFFAFYSVCVAALRGIGNTRMAMIVTVTQNAASVIFSSILIYAFGLGVYGAAFGMIAGRAVGAVLGVLMLKKAGVVEKIREMFTLRIDWPMQKKILQFGIPQSIEMVFYLLGKVLANMFILQAGIDQVAANAAAFPVTDFLTFATAGFTVLATTTIAYAKGIGDDAMAKRYLKKIFWMTAATGFLSILALLPLIPGLLSMYHLTETAFQTARNVVMLQAVMLIPFFPLGFLLPAGFRGAGDVVAPTVCSIVAVWCFRLPIAFLCASVLQMGAIGIWIGMWADFLFRAVYSLIRWRRGKWLKFKSV